MSRYDTIIIGAGLAGLATACQLVQVGQKVLVIAHGAGALLLASGCIDVLGYQPADSREPIKDPFCSLDNFLQEQPNHPYNFVSPQNIKAGVATFQGLTSQGALDYQGTVDKNWLLPSTIGAIHPTCLAPVSLAQGELSQRDRMLIVGFKELRDFYPALISQNLNAQELGVKTVALTIDLPLIPRADALNVTPLELAYVFEQPDFRAKVVKALGRKHKNYERIGFPAVLGLDRHAEVLADLEKRLGKRVFEISTLPPSVPGRRLFDTLRQTFIKAGGRLIIGSKVVDGVLAAGQVKQIRFETANRLKVITAKNYVLATGGIYGGGIQTDSDGGTGRVWEPIFGLPVEADSNRHNWFTTGFLDPKGQPFASYGVQVNDRLNPVNGRNDPLAENLYIAGATIAGSDWTRGRTGDGVALATAAAIVEQIEDGG